MLHGQSNSHLREGERENKWFEQNEFIILETLSHAQSWGGFGPR